MLTKETLERRAALRKKHIQVIRTFINKMGALPRCNGSDIERQYYNYVMKNKEMFADLLYQHDPAKLHTHHQKSDAYKMAMADMAEAGGLILDNSILVEGGLF